MRFEARLRKQPAHQDCNIENRCSTAAQLHGVLPRDTWRDSNGLRSRFRIRCRWALKIAHLQGASREARGAAVLGCCIVMTALGSGLDPFLKHFSSLGGRRQERDVQKGGGNTPQNLLLFTAIYREWKSSNNRKYFQLNRPYIRLHVFIETSVMLSMNLY